MERKRYGAEFKREAVKLASQPGQSKRQVAQELGKGNSSGRATWTNDHETTQISQ